MTMIQWVNTDGLTNYQVIIAQMEHVAQEIIENKSNDIIILTEHRDVITFGTNSNVTDLLFQTTIPVVATGRGGKYTYHGPGQRIIYPVMDLRVNPWDHDLKKYINFLHNWIIATLKYFHIEAFIDKDHVGIWVNKNGQNKKIAAIGVRARKWIVFHGVAVNIFTDLSKFDSFIPCGINNLGVTSFFDIGVNISLEEFDEILKKEYHTIFKLV